MLCVLIGRELEGAVLELVLDGVEKCVGGVDDCVGEATVRHDGEGVGRVRDGTLRDVERQPVDY